MTRSACKPAYRLHRAGPRHRVLQAAGRGQRYRWCIAGDLAQSHVADRIYAAGTHRDLVEPWTTLKVRSWRKEPIHPRKLPVSPNVTFNRFRRILWSTVSKAALTSNKANNISSALSVAP